MYARLASELVEVGNQSWQLFSFAHERPKTWVLALCTALVLNGVTMSAPVLLGTCIPVCKTRMFLAGADTLFDLCYLILAVFFSSADDFGQPDKWVIAALSILYPIFSLVRRQFSMARSLTRHQSNGENNTRRSAADDAAASSSGFGSLFRIY